MNKPIEVIHGKKVERFSEDKLLRLKDYFQRAGYKNEPVEPSGAYNVLVFRRKDRVKTILWRFTGG